MRAAYWLIQRLRGLIYRLGWRPPLGSIWHSPSLHWIYAYRDADVAQALRRAIDRSE